ncbi:MAG: hypothetical protein V1778_00080 [bacterium]
MYGEKHPEDEAVYTLQGGLGKPSGRVSVTRRELEQARRTGQQIVRTVTSGDWDARVAVDLERASLALMADDKRLGRK